MFKKLKDKLAEEVKSSPQRIQQFAQAAQAAVTSASSSISDITNNDLFSIGDNDGQQSRPARLQPSPSSRQNTFQDVLLVQPLESTDLNPGQEVLDNQRLRRLSNSSLASDISFRLPSYETPSMYHLQSDMEVSASEAEERGFSSGAVSLDRVTKEQLYAAYRRTQERYTKYRTQYGDLARHYKLLERENAKARSVLVETQDKALRRISELKEQCTLEQSAKAHLEKALRIEIEEKSMKIEALNMKVQVLQNNLDISNDTNSNENINKEVMQKENDVQLINLSNENESKPSSEETNLTEITILNTKIEKMEQLLNKYKESLKNSKEKNSQVVTELQKLSHELENKNKEIDHFKITAKQLDEAVHKIQELSSANEDLQNKINTYDFTKTKEMSELEIDLQRAKEEITQLQSKIEVFTKREEDYAISLAENKLSIHKELENKESEIKSLKDNLSTTQKEIQSLNIVINDYKTNIASLEDERSKLINDNKEFNILKSKLNDLESQLQEVRKKHQIQEQLKTKADEEYKCLQLQMKQETAEKLAMIDRNTYLENRNMQLTEENSKKSSQISVLENELQLHKNSYVKNEDIEKEKEEMHNELKMWKVKYDKLESEIQEEREELVKLQSEIEKLLVNHELTQKQNIEFRETISELKTINATLQDQITNNDRLKENLKNVASAVSELHNLIDFTSNEAVSVKEQFTGMFLDLERDLKFTLHNFNDKELEFINNQHEALKMDFNALQQKLKSTSDHDLNTSKIITSLQDENNNLKTLITQLESDKNFEIESKTNIQKLYEEALKNIEVLKHEQNELVSKIKDTANKSKNLEAALDLANAKALSEKEQITSVQNLNQNLLDQLNIAKNKNDLLSEEIKRLSHEQDNNLDQLATLTKENRELKNNSEELETKIIHGTKLQENIKTLSDENTLLKNQLEKINCNIKELESEISEVRKSHAAIEIEKDHLNNVIEKLESKENNKLSKADVKSTQTDEIMEIHEESNKIKTSELSSSNNITNDTVVNENVITNTEYIDLKNDNDALKEENRRLQSDVEGLQKYLTKISKENSVLNDKLRELIATSDHSPDNNGDLNDVTEFKNELQVTREKIENLLRENNLLVEENLELKDQLESHKYTNPTETSNNSDSELANIKEKYKSLVQSNTKTEQKLIDSEQLNRSLNSNIQQVQDKNEKLKMSNEKLERKLDEALVSLRHLHSLQENTELEYLRNILYEYLTGSGIHSITLAKVLSAIVKFDDTQTQLVLQKEKERQGFLRQLGLI